MAEDFLSFLVDETFKLQKSGEVELSSLELKIKDYGLNFLKGEFIPQTQMLKFNAPFGTFDVPVTWKIFGVENDVGHTLLWKENDTDLFFSVLNKVWGLKMEKLLITHADGFCYLVALKVGEDCCLHDLINPQEWLKAA